MVELREHVLGALRHMPARPVVNETDDVIPSPPLAGAVVAAEALHSVEQAAEVKRAAIRELGQAPPRRPAVNLEEAGVVEEEGVRVGGGRAGEEAVDGLPLGGEGEGGDVEGLRRRPGRRGHDAADTVALGDGADARDVGKRVRELLLRRAEHRRLRDGGVGAEAAAGRGCGGGGEGAALAHRPAVGAS